jgi:hypothetical protein
MSNDKWGRLIVRVVELSISVRKLVFLEMRGISRVQLALDALLPVVHVISGIIKPRLLGESERSIIINLK